MRRRLEDSYQVLFEALATAMRSEASISWRRSSQVHKTFARKHETSPLAHIHSRSPATRSGPAIIGSTTSSITPLAYKLPTLKPALVDNEISNSLDRLCQHSFSLRYPLRLVPQTRIPTASRTLKLLSLSAKSGGVAPCSLGKLYVACFWLVLGDEGLKVRMPVRDSREPTCGGYDCDRN
ncbi:fad binding domain-containing protein [Moniliophthora roreri]|nr:fad binding domain-containing protein [Moniliophthora roreri]